MRRVRLANLNFKKNVDMGSGWTHAQNGRKNVKNKS